MGVRALPAGLVRIADIGRLLGVSRQRAGQLVDTSSFPVPADRIGPSRVWNRTEVEWWADDGWWGTRPWRPDR